MEAIEFAGVVGGRAAVVDAPAFVQAQTELFPLAPIKRERVPCPMEDPVYGLYRHQYFGYYPTCWRAFPPGWGCPSPEAPNPALEFQRRNRAIRCRRTRRRRRTGRDLCRSRVRARRGCPATVVILSRRCPRRERSPFDIDAAPGGRAPGPGASGAFPSRGRDGFA